MPTLKTGMLSPDLPFGALVSGVTLTAMADEAVRAELRALFEDRGLIVFRGVEGNELQVEISKVFGPLADHPVAGVQRVAGVEGVIDMRFAPDNGTILEIDGERVANWLPWHFDHCYTDKLNRGSVLRAISISPRGGLTGFLDGIEAHQRLPQALRDQIDGLEIVYRMELDIPRMRFGRTPGIRELTTAQVTQKIMKNRDIFPRAIHPMVFERAGDGRKVLHVSPWMALGIAGHENAAGDALLEDVIAAMTTDAPTYFHRWQSDDMIAWDNWRMLHRVTGADPDYERRMQRTTIVGDYALGRLELGGKTHAALAMTV